MIRRPASLHGLRPGTVRPLQRYYQDATTSCRPSRRASFPSLGGTSGPLVLFAPRRTSAPPRPGVGHPVSPAGNSPRRRQDLPSSWETSMFRLQCSFRLRRDCLHQTNYGVAAWPPVGEQQRLPRKVFRSSIALLSDSLSTLRRVRYLARRKTRFRPLVRRYRTGFPPARFLRKVSELFPYISSPFPKLCLAQ